jgi:ketosteroid isomerase-like protein
MHRTLIALCLLALSLSLSAQSSPAPQSKTPPAKGETAPVDRAYLQSIWDGWASNDIEKQGRFYAQGSGHLFFDVAPLKYNTWEEYKAGVAPSLKDSPKVTYTLSNDVQIHPAGPYTWVAGTLDMAGASPQGEAQKLTLRWTAVFELQDGRWVITHEHVSAPAEMPEQ